MRITVLMLEILQRNFFNFTGGKNRPKIENSQIFEVEMYTCFSEHLHHNFTLEKEMSDWGVGNL